MLSLANLGDHASLGAAALKPLERAVDGLAVLDMDLRHLYFPPSEVSGSFQDTLRAINYGFNICIISAMRKIVKSFFQKLPASPQSFLW